MAEWFKAIECKSISVKAIVGSSPTLFNKVDNINAFFSLIG